MNNIPNLQTIDKIKTPSQVMRIYSVWFRHIRVYARHLISNGLPPFLEPLIFLGALGLGFKHFINEMAGIPYIIFIASGIVAAPAMFTAAYECSFGTFIRMEYDKTYDGMLSSSINVKDLILGEILFAGTKGFFFSASVLFVISLFGYVSFPLALLAPFGGFLTGIVFASLSLVITYFVTTINHFNFYFTGFLSPLFFFSDMIFPITNLPKSIQIVGELFPLIHNVRIIRAFCLNKITYPLLYDFLYIIIFSLIFTLFAVKLLKKRLIE